jgi:hypothetical protein
MPRQIKSLARALGADVVARLPKTGGGAFGAARFGKIVAELQQNLTPGHGKRPGRPTRSDWTRRPKVPMSRNTEQRLIQLARQASSPTRKVSPMQVAAQLLEEALTGLPRE